ncbi:MAG: hypothetical protein QOD06_1594 [Candidatus Binatota bacterium]|nr:hypothetical protein [Candidatus Binatota bacterium]
MGYGFAMRSSRPITAWAGGFDAPKQEQPGLRLVDSHDTDRDGARDAVLFLDRALRALVRQESRCRHALGVLLELLRTKDGLDDLGFVRLGDYARERLGISGSEADALRRVAGRLRGLPSIARSFEQGAISWTKVRLLAVVARPETEGMWIEIARGSTVRELEGLVRGGDSAPATLAPAAHHVAAAEIECIHEDDGTEIDGEPRVRFRMRVPGPVWLLFRRVVELARSVCGASVPTWKGVEAIAAEATSGVAQQTSSGDPGDDAAPRREGARRSVGVLPDSCFRSDRAPLPAPIPDGVAARLGVAGADLAEAMPDDVDRLAAGADHVDSFELDRRMRQIVRSYQRIDWRCGRLLAILLRNRHLLSEIGFGSFELYVQERLGISIRKARALVSLARQSEELPALGRAYREGALSWVRAMTVVPLVRRSDEAVTRQWIERARRVTVRRLADEVGWAVEMRAIGGHGAETPCPPPFGAALDRLEREVQTRMEEAFPAAWPVASANACEPPRPAASYPLEFSGPASVVALFRQTIIAWSQLGEPPWVALCRLLVHVASEWERQGRRARDRILTRDRYRCLVPACSSRTNLHVHHFVFRSAGGGDEADNLGAVCEAHHRRGIHAGKVRARGEAPHDIVWELGVRPGKAPLATLRQDAYLEGGDRMR